MRALGGISPAVRAYTIHTLDHEPALRRQLMLRAIELLAAGKIKPPAAMVLKLSQAQQAHAMLDAGEVLGKLVLVPDRL
jgi:NADPH2:quinone reductase